MNFIFPQNKNIRVLDCTLRDGIRLFDCAMSDDEIRRISSKLAKAKIDIVEIGFLRDPKAIAYKGNSTYFTDVNQIKSFIDKSSQSLYVAFTDYGMFDFDTLLPYDGLSLGGIRVGFTKKDYDINFQDVVRKLEIVKNRGYKLFIQTVNSLNYKDRELLDLVEKVNTIKPYSFGIVDTYGAMYMNDVNRIYNLIDNNLDNNIMVDFHSHNNYQMSFALAQEVIRLSHGKRHIIIDGTLKGMGLVAGNLCIELIVDYLIRTLDYNYDLDTILDVIDEYIYDYGQKYNWGYSIPALMAGVYRAHPKNIIYLTEKFRLDTKDVKYILSMIDPQKRQTYDYDNIERLYIEYVAHKIDDTLAIEKIKSLIGQREVMVMVPGKSLDFYRKIISDYIEQSNPVIITVNFNTDINDSITFYGNQKRYNNSHNPNKRTIISSNISPESCSDDIVVNYESLIMREFKHFENSTIMLLNLLKRLVITNIVIAGFDGYTVGQENYFDYTLNVRRHEIEFEEYNSDTMIMFERIAHSILQTGKIRFITPSRFEEVLEKQ